ncbi:MAG: methyltransferase domain-containing protein [Deltaproteobacteria bacterium]|nr:methyltransferase domain-containing protein [Deltaproteobacteria bacterium]
MTSTPNPAQDPKRIPPHSPLLQYYDTDTERRQYVDDLFNKTARHYNTIERIFGNGGIWYRRFSLGRAGLGPGMRVLDVAVGTAAVAQGAARLVAPGGKVFGVDPNKGMLGEARKVFHGPLTRGVAEALPFKTGQFDFVTMGIALRHVPDLVAAFSEYLRVLKPGGKVWILEGHLPESKLGHALTRFAWKTVIPGAHAALHARPRCEGADGLLLGHGREVRPARDHPGLDAHRRLRRPEVQGRRARSVLRVHRHQAPLAPAAAHFVIRARSGCRDNTALCRAIGPSRPAARSSGK